MALCKITRLVADDNEWQPKNQLAFKTSTANSSSSTLSTLNAVFSWNATFANQAQFFNSTLTGKFHHLGEQWRMNALKLNHRLMTLTANDTDFSRLHRTINYINRVYTRHCQLTITMTKIKIEKQTCSDFSATAERTWELFWCNKSGSKNVIDNNSEHFCGFTDRFQSL